MTAPAVLVLQLPGVNCETETVRALERVGLAPRVLRWTLDSERLRDFAAFVLPGGFSYQDRVRAGALAAKSAAVEALAAEAERGKPVLGICNGAQVLVEAGLVPGGAGVELALARNRMPGRAGYYAAWIELRIEASNCLFTRGIQPGTVLPMPVAHGEGRFLGAPGRMAELLGAGCVPLRYADPGGQAATEFPALPNGSELAVAAVSNPSGNVLAIMPHPERAQDLAGLARTAAGPWARERERRLLEGALDPGDGPGLEIFRGLARHLGVTA